MDALVDLRERLWKTTKPDSTLDRNLASACGIAWSSDEEGQFGGYDIMPKRVHFTAYMDAAVLLIPKRWVPTNLSFPGHRRNALYYFRINPPPEHKAWAEGGILEGGFTAPLAICTAAVEAQIRDLKYRGVK